MELISAVYDAKRSGLKTEPCGTPPTNGQGNIVVPDKWTARVLPVTYESNDLRTVASIPNEHKLCKMIKCKM